MLEQVDQALTSHEERELFLDLCQFLRDYEQAGNDISNVNWKMMEELADRYL